MDLPKLKETTLGIRISRSFRIPSVSGEIIDRLVSNPRSPFSRDKFTATQPLIDFQGELKGRALLSQELDHSLAIDIDGTVLKVSSDSLDDSIKTIRDTYLPTITRDVFEKYSIFNINRLGALFEFELPFSSKLGSKILSRATKGSFSNPSLFSLKFAERSTDPLSFVLREYYDYQNHIFLIQGEDEAINLKYDFQLYFRPEVERVGDLDIAGFLKAAQENVKSKFLALIEGYEEA